MVVTIRSIRLATPPCPPAHILSRFRPQAGIKTGDRILAVNAVPVIGQIHANCAELIAAVGRAGAPLTLKLAPRMMPNIDGSGAPQPPGSPMGGGPRAQRTPPKQLPPNWVEANVGHAGKYYVNTATGKCTWEHPSWDELEGVTEDDWNDAAETQASFKLVIMPEGHGSFDIPGGPCDFGGLVPLEGIEFELHHDSTNPKATGPMKPVPPGGGLLIERGDIEIYKKAALAELSGAAVCLLVNDKAEESLFNIRMPGGKQEVDVSIPVTNISKLAGYELLDMLREGVRVRARLTPTIPSSQVSFVDRQRMTTTIRITKAEHVRGLKLAKKNGCFYVTEPPRLGPGADMITANAKLVQVRGKEIDGKNEKKIMKLFTKVPIVIVVNNNELLPDPSYPALPAEPATVDVSKHSVAPVLARAPDVQDPAVPMRDTDTLVVADVGKRCKVGKYGAGIIKFVGFHHVDLVPRCGVALEQPIGKNNGMVKGAKYFECDAQRGILVPPKFVRVLDVMKPPTTRAPTPKPTLATGRVKRASNGNVRFGGTELCLYPDGEPRGEATASASAGASASEPVAAPDATERLVHTTRPAATDHTLPVGTAGNVSVGDRVTVEDKGDGVVRFVGPHAMSGKLRIGVELDQALGKNNGTVKVCRCDMPVRLIKMGVEMPGRPVHAWSDVQTP